MNSLRHALTGSFLGLALGAAVATTSPAVEGCAAFKAEVPTLESDAAQLGEKAASCVLGEVVIGDTNPATIGLACLISSIPTVIAMTSMLASQIEAKLATDAGAVGMVLGLDPHVLAARLRSVK